ASITLSSRHVRPELWSIAEFVCDSLSRQTQNSGTAYVFLPTQQKIIAAGQWLSKRTPLFSHLINSLAELRLVVRCVMCGVRKLADIAKLLPNHAERDERGSYKLAW